MNDFSQIVRSALEYYDENTIKFYDNIHSFKYYNINKQLGEITFYDKEKQKIKKTSYEIIGKYIHKQNIWTWGWSIPVLQKNLNKISKKILLYALELDSIDNALKTEFITSRYQISNPIQMDIHVALASFLSKQPCIFRLDYTNKMKREIINTHSDTYIKIDRHPKKEEMIQTFYLSLKDI